MALMGTQKLQASPQSGQCGYEWTVEMWKTQDIGQRGTVGTGTVGTGPSGQQGFSISKFPSGPADTVGA